MILSESHLAKVLSKDKFIKWLKEKNELTFIYNENSLNGNSLCNFLRQTDEFSNIEYLHIEVAIIEYRISEHVIQLSLPEWATEFSEKIFDYYYSEDSGKCDVMVKQILAYFGEY